MAVGLAGRLRCDARSHKGALRYHSRGAALRSLRSWLSRASQIALRRASTRADSRCCASRRPTSRPHRVPPTAQQRWGCSTAHAITVVGKAVGGCAPAATYAAPSSAERVAARVQRASSSDSPRLFERNDRREWSEFLGGPCDRAAQGTPRAARGCRIRAPAHTRPRLCALRPFKQPVMNSTIAQLEAFASALFEAAGMDADKATTLSQLLVLTDAMGRRTHGLAMVPLYLAELAKGTMAKSGEPEVVKQRGVVALWDGGYLPGQYVVARAIDWAMPRAADSGIAAVTIRRSHHIGCLAALALRAVDEGLRRVDRQLRSRRRARRALRRHRGAVHARPVRDRLPRHAEPGAGRHLRVDHHHVDDTPEGGRGRAIRSALAARPRRPTHHRPACARAQHAARFAAADRRPRPRPQGLRPGADGRGAVAGAGRAMAASMRPSAGAATPICR